MTREEVSRRVAADLAGALRDAGVDACFGLPGGGPNLDMIGAAMRAGLRFVLGHGEAAACTMAATYGLLTGRPGMCVVTRGPGVASAVNGLAQATLDRFPLLLVSDAVPGADAPRVAHQRFAQTAVTSPVTRWSGTLGARRPRDAVAAALALAGGPPAGAVHLDFDPTADGDNPPPRTPEPGGSGVPAAARELAGHARRPVLLLGAEAIPDADAVRRIVAELGCPVLTTYHAKGLVPDSSPYAAGHYTGAALERAVLDRADLVVAVGVDPAEPLPTPWRYRMPVITVRPGESADSYFPAAVPLTGPVAGLLADLRSRLRGEWEADAAPSARRAAERALREAGNGATGAGMAVHEVVDTVRRAAAPTARVTVDAGAHMLLVMPLWPAEEPYSVLISNGLATMGFAVPAAIGTALADPARPVICFVGDGGLGMTLAELETIARLALDITVVVFNDAALSLIEVKQRADQGGPAAVRYAASDFAQVARGLGMPASVVRDVGELERALAGSRSGPRLVDARVDPVSYRRVVEVARG